MKRILQLAFGLAAVTLALTLGVFSVRLVGGADATSLDGPSSGVAVTPSPSADSTVVASPSAAAAATVSATSTAAAATPTSAVAATKVIDYVPKDPGGNAVSGSCFASSLSVDAPDAWRCMTGNQILDPCFVLPGLTSSAGNPDLVCDPNPLTGDPGVRLRLTQPLPSPQTANSGHDGVWLLQLTDGEICQFATGATGVVAGERINYFCSQPGVTPSSIPTQSVAIVGNPVSDTVWTAKRAVITSGSEGIVAQSTEVVPLKTVVRGR